MNELNLPPLVFVWIVFWLGLIDSDVDVVVSVARWFGQKNRSGSFEEKKRENSKLPKIGGYFCSKKPLAFAVYASLKKNANTESKSQDPATLVVVQIWRERETPR